MKKDLLMPESDEAVLVHGLCRMDERAWEEFAQRYHRPLLAFTIARLGTSADAAEEAVQMAFVRAVRSIGTFDPAKGTLWGWLKAVTLNEAATLARRQRRHEGNVSLSALPPDVAGKIFERSPLAGEVVARADFQETVQDALMAINPHYREVLVMKYVDGLKISEIARALGVSDKAVESSLSRSREAFARAFSRRTGDGRYGIPEHTL